MKNTYKLLLLFLLLGSITNITAQQYDWSLPAPIEISENDKTNAWLGETGNFGPIILWEEAINDSSTAIMYHRYLTNSPPVVLLSEAGVHFRNPQCRNAPYGVVNTTFLVFYEREYNGKTRLYYLESTDDGDFSEPVPLAVDGMQNHELALSTPDELRFAAWNNDGNILASQRIVENGNLTFGTPDTIDVGDCSQPCLNIESRLCWINNSSGASEIFKSGYLFGEWENPEQLFVGENVHQLLSGGEFWVSHVLSWTFYEDGVWKVANSDGWDLEYLDYTADAPFDFGVYTMDVVFGKDAKWTGDYVFACAKNDGQFDEIFLYSNLNNLGLDQFSYLETQSRNPKFYMGEIDQNGWWTYLIWEALVDGHWQLYYSKAYFLIGAIEENLLSKDIRVFHGAAAEYLQIQNKTLMDFSVEIFDLSGKRIYQGHFDEQENRVAITGWNRGVYFVRISGEGTYFTKKVILN